MASSRSSRWWESGAQASGRRVPGSSVGRPRGRLGHAGIGRPVDEVEAALEATLPSGGPGGPPDGGTGGPADDGAGATNLS